MNKLKPVPSQAFYDEFITAEPKYVENRRAEIKHQSGIKTSKALGLSYEFLFCNLNEDQWWGFLFSILRYRSLPLSIYYPKLQNGVLQSLHLPEIQSFKLERPRPSQAGLSSIVFPR